LTHGGKARDVIKLSKILWDFLKFDILKVPVLV